LVFSSRFLRWRLVYPISAAALLSFSLAIFRSAGGLFINLGMTFLGILVTVAYVDLVLREHQARQWAETLDRINKRLDNLATVASAQFRVAFGLTPDVCDEVAMQSSDDRLRRTEVARVAEQVLRPIAAQRVAAINREGWRNLNRQLQITWNFGDHLMELHGTQLNPEVFPILMDIQDRMWSLMNRYSAFPDVLGVPDNELSLNTRGESVVPLKRSLEHSMAKDISAVLDLTVRILNYLNHAPIRRVRTIRAKSSLISLKPSEKSTLENLLPEFLESLESTRIL